MKRVQSLTSLDGYRHEQPADAPPPRDDGPNKAQADALNACMAYQADAIQHLTDAITTRPAPAKAWTFTIKRDNRGDITSITAIAH